MGVLFCLTKDSAQLNLEVLLVRRLAYRLETAESTFNDPCNICMTRR